MSKKSSTFVANLVFCGYLVLKRSKVVEKIARNNKKYIQ